MNILLVNEAGCFAPGITALAKALSARHRVVIVAPLTSRFGSGHQLTVSTYPLRVKQYFVFNKIKIFSVNGTPCDCVTLALDKVLKSKPDLIVTGICDHNNRGETIYSSGVVSAAIQGTIHGIPSIAVSAKIRDASSEKSFEEVAANFARNLDFFIKNLSPSSTLNVNYPAKITARKIKFTHLTYGMIKNEYGHEVNPMGTQFYWLKSPLMGFALESLEQKGDLYWLKNGHITVTPLKLDLSDDVAIQVIERTGVIL